ncbi:NF-kappa-B essential modulator-like [Malaya genurostris]|uniref:NF-kappa-B essential modulator-like n=1 Tax=Malaya genurostris TaxID=325434 RepID=UPI0026F3AB75|nr:NF-kappa-B essential modulator-like [Malaya genurostris]
MSDEESFIVLGSTPTPSMEFYKPEDSIPPSSKLMETSSTQINSNNFSLIQADESLNGAISMHENQPLSKNNTNSIGNSLAASVIMGETKPSLLQVFPSLMSSSLSIDEVQTLQHLVDEYGKMKESLQNSNVAMRKNFVNIQKWQDEVKVKFLDQERAIDGLKAVIDSLTSENQALKQALAARETHIKAQETQIQTEILAAQQETKDLAKQIEAERTSAGEEIDELRKAVSEKESILKNLAKEIERLELERQEFVVINSNKPDSKDRADFEFINKEEHNRQLKMLQREMSVVVAKNLEFEDMKKVYIDELNCLKANLIAAEELHAKYRAEIHRLAKEVESKSVSFAENFRELKSVSEQVDVLTAQLDIYKNDFEAERAARAEIASEKDRVMSDLKLLQKRNQQLIDEVQKGRSAEENAIRAANESLDNRDPKRVSEGASGGTSSNPTTDDQEFKRLVLHCPLCSGVYSDLATLQNHVEDCSGVE